MTKLVALLKAKRTALNYSLRDVQKLSNNTITHTYIMNIEKEISVPSPKKLKIIASIYKLDFLELMALAGHLEDKKVRS